MGPEFEVHEIRAFLAVADELHFGRAADRLVLTSSRVSQMIRTLERRVGGRLFDRTSRRVRLTPLGEQFRETVGASFRELEAAFAAARTAASGVVGVLRLGMYSPLNGGPHLTEIIRTFEDRHPGAHVVNIDTMGRDQYDWLHKRDVDVLAMRLPVSDPAFETGPELSVEERIVLVACWHPLAQRSAVTYEELGDFVMPFADFVPREVIDAFIPPHTPSGRPVQRVIVRTITESLMQVAAGKLIHPTVRSYVDHYHHPGIVAVPIDDLPPSRTALIWRVDDRDAGVEAFAKAAVDVIAERRPQR